MRLNFKIILTITFFIAAIFSIAQNSNFAEYMVEDGLVMSQIESITQDEEGNLWIGTIGGLSKFNGKSFVNYTQKEGLAEDWINVVHYSEKTKTLWLGHRGGGLSKKKLGEKQFTDLQIEAFTKYGKINDLKEDNDGNLWLAVEKVGLLKYNIQDNTTISIQGVNTSNITALYIDKNNMLWLSSINGVDIVDMSNMEKIHSLNNTNVLPSNAVNTVVGVFGKEIWLGTQKSGVVRLLIPEDKAGYMSFSQVEFVTMKDGITENDVTNIYEDSDHNIWLGTNRSGIMQFVPKRFDANEERFHLGDINIFSNKFELKYYQANTFFEDREGNLWMGTEYGLLKYMGELFKIYNQHDNLINNLVWSICEDQSGNMWFGTSKGVSRFNFPSINGNKQYHTPVVKNFTTKDGLADNIIISMFQDSNKDIWMGTENNGVFTMSEAGKVKRKWTVGDGLVSNKIFSIEEDNKGNIWLGTDKGVSIIEKQRKKIVNYTEEDGIGGEKVYSVFSDSKGRVWLGILGGDLTIFEEGKFRIFSDKEGLPYKFVIGTAEDQNGNLWFAAYSDGIVKYDGSSFKKYGLDNGLKSNSIHFITCDNDNNIWVGQSVGLDKFDLENDRFVFYGSKQGFVGMETNENAIHKDRMGNIWFGTIRGVVKFNPKKDEKNLMEPLTKINRMNLYMNEEEMIDGASYSYTENNFTFYNQGVCLTNADEVYYKYQLEGLSNQWSSPTKNAEFNTGNLPAGSYKFNVLASNNNGIWNKEATSFSFVVTPPFWKTWWFYSIVSVLSLIGVVAFIKIRERKMLKRQEELEHTVALRTEELRKEKEVVEAQNHNIKESISYARRIQEAILPPQNVIEKILPESFILYKPKDVVSGDFYWINEKNNITYVAAVDCTGHGVPGAFMSLIGYNILEKVLNDNDNLAPNEILKGLSTEISRALRQDGEDKTIKDGMDLALIAIDMNKRELEFSGAYNPMYLVRNKELTEYKADKLPIGKGSVKKGVDFENQKISIESGDIVYMFSDGFADQKGGDKKKKYFYPPFRSFLTEISELPLKEQKQKLEDELVRWRGDVEQIDDVLVLGIRI